MNFEDTTTVRLADLASRTAVFDAVALEQIVDAAYDTGMLQVQGPYQPVFDEFQIGFAVPRVGIIDGSWSPVGGAVRHEARFQLSGVSTEAAIRVDALWRGRIVARAVPNTGRIIDAAVERPDIASIDADIIADLGALPGDPAVLEQERRDRLLLRMKATFAQPDAADDDLIDHWLEGNGLASVSDLMLDAQGVIHGGTVQVTFSAPDPAPPSPVPLPVFAALLVRDNTFSVVNLLAESKIVRDQLLSLGLGPPRDGSLPQRHPVVVVWVLPADVFDDSDWPGGTAGATGPQQRAERRLAAGRWLAREGIGLVATT